MREKVWRRIAIASLVALGLYIGGSLIYDKFETLEAQGKAQELAEPVDKLCKKDAETRAQIGADKCEKAAEVQAEPPVPEAIPGEDGEDGRGIRGTRIDGQNLIVAYTDGTEQNVGVVVGEDGKVGKDGRGITSTEIAKGQLQVNYTDGSSELLGVVVGRDGRDGSDGEPGRGISSTAAIDGRLIISYTDGTSEDAGPLPQGPPGAQGPAGPTCPPNTKLESRVVTSNDVPPVEETWFVCVQQPPPPEGEEEGDGNG